MTVTRSASAAARRTWRPRVPGRAGTAAPGTAAAPWRRAGKRVARAAAAAVAVAVVAVAGVTGRPALAASFALLGHLRWIWIPAAIAGESASMAAFAIMLRRLLAAGGASVGVRPMLATVYAPTRCRSRFRWPGPSWPRLSPSAASPGRARMPRWPAGRCWPAGGLLGRRGPRRGRRRAGVRENPGRSSRCSRRCARRSGPGRGGRRCARAAAARCAGAARGVDAAARVPAAPPPGR